MPDFRSEDIVKSKDRMVALETFEMMFLSEEQYLANLGAYMVRKCDFIEFVMKQWQKYTVQFNQDLEDRYQHYDSFSNQGGLNKSQFIQLIKDLKINTVLSF